MPDDAQLHAWSALVAVYQSVLHDVVQALEGEAALDSGVFSALAYLARAEPSGRLPLGALHDLMHPRYSQPGLSRLVQRMESAGLLERRSDPIDGRATLLAVTRRGRTCFRRAHAVYSAAVREHFLEHLEPCEQARLAADLGRVLVRRAETARG